MIVASSPPLESAESAARLGREWRVPAVMDIQDQWPDNFVHIMPRPARAMGKLALAPYYAAERRAYQSATGIIGVARGYVEHGLAVGGPKQHTGVFPLGVDLAELTSATEQGARQYAEQWTKPPGQIWMLYSGSLSHSYDFMTILESADLTRRRYGRQVRFILTGTGDLADRGRRLVAQRHLDNVTLTGFLEFPEYAYVLSQADVGFNASFPSALIYLPNKIFYYLAAGAAVLNTIPGECAELVAEHGCGLTYSAGDVEGCSQAVSALVESPDRLAGMRTAARRLAETVFDRRLVYADLVRFLEGVGRCPAAGEA
jgi:glycosyltransferase involved in cell wall biosynthesis